MTAARVVLQHGNRRTWLARRRAGITATDAVVILGLAPWAHRTELAVWLDKHQPQPDSGSWRMRRGQALEPVMAQEYARMHPDSTVTKPPLLLAHPTMPWLMASLDYLVRDEQDQTRVMDCKSSAKWQEWENDATPEHYAAQVQIQLCVTGLDEGILWADVDSRLQRRIIQRDDAWLAEALPILHRWWWLHVVMGRLPPLVGADYPMLRHLWTPEPDTEAEATPDVIEAWETWCALDAECKERHPRLDQAKVDIRAAMATATKLTHPETGQRIAIMTRGANPSLRINKPKEIVPA